MTKSNVTINVFAGDHDHEHCHREPVHVDWIVRGAQLVAIHRDVIMIQITDSQQFSATVEFRSSRGNLATVDGTPTWTVSDLALLNLTVAPDGMSATVAAVGPVGTGQLVVTADADMGAGVRPVTGSLDVVIVAGEANVVNVVPGAPSEIP